MITTANPTKYIWPPRPDKAIPREATDFLKNSTWIAQLKYNDSRCLIKYLPDGTVELWNRHGERFRDYTPPDWLLQQLQEAREKLGLPAGEYHLLDGGLLDKKHAAIKDCVVIWDVLVASGIQLLGTTYQHRYDMLFAHNLSTSPIWTYSHPTYPKPYAFGFSLTQNVFYPANYHSQHWDGLWADIAVINAPYTTGKPTDKNYKISPLIEGLVFKDAQGKLKQAFKEKNNSHWIMRSRVATGRSEF